MKLDQQKSLREICKSSEFKMNYKTFIRNQTNFSCVYFFVVLSSGYTRDDIYQIREA